MNRRQFHQTTLAALLTSTPLTTVAQTWPDRPQRWLLSQPPGSGPDAMARLISEQLARQWQHAIVVENRPGGQNVIGAQAAAKFPADGYHFYFATAAALVVNSYLFKALPYDPQKDFTPVGMIGKVPFAITVNSASPLKSLADLVAYAKANPGRLNVANEGPKTFGGMMTRLIAAQLGIQINPVSYVSVAAAVTDTVGGQTEVLVSDVPAAAAMVKAGRLRPLAVTTAKRVAAWEGVPALHETLPGFDYAGWIGIVAPSGTPPAVLQRFNRDLDALLSQPEMAARLLAIGPITEGAGTLEQMSSFMNAEHARWAKLTRELGIVPE